MQKSRLFQVPDTSKGQGKMSRVLYQEVISKNFEIIQKFLSKFNTIHIREQQMQQIVNQINQRMNKMQNDSSNLHHQFRTINFAIEREIASIKNQLTSIIQINRNKNNSVQKNSKNSRGGIKNRNSRTDNKNRNKRISKLSFEKRNRKSMYFKESLTYPSKQRIAQLQSKKSMEQFFNGQVSSNNNQMSQSQFSQNQNSLQKTQIMENLQNLVGSQISKLKSYLGEKLQQLTQEMQGNSEMLTDKVKNMSLIIEQISGTYITKRQTKQDHTKTLSTAEKMMNEMINNKQQLMLIVHSNLQKGLLNARNEIEMNSFRISCCQTAVQKCRLQIGKTNNQVEEIKHKIIQDEKKRRQIYADGSQTKNALACMQSKINNYTELIKKYIKSSPSFNKNELDKSQSDFFFSRQGFNKDQNSSITNGFFNYNSTEVGKRSGFINQFSCNDENMNFYDSEKLEKLQQRQMGIQRPHSQSRKLRAASLKKVNINTPTVQNRNRNHNCSKYLTENKPVSLNMWKKRTNQILEKSNKPKIF